MKIGSIELTGNVVLAPMAGVTDPPFRLMVQSFGVSAVWTEMISADGLVRSRGSFGTVDIKGHRVPTVFQLYGTDPRVMADAARISEQDGASAVDVNMGCPAEAIVRKGAGAALMTNVGLAARIVRAVRGAVTIPVTVKLRSGWDENNQNAAFVAAAVEHEGADAVIVHSRCRGRKHGGPPSLGIIEEVKQATSIPVIGNGGIRNENHAAAMIHRTGCDGVMIGRGALGRPWLPGRILEASGRSLKPDRSTMTLFQVVREHFHRLMNWCDPLTGMKRFHRHLVWYSKGLQGGPQFRRSIHLERDPHRMMEAVEQFFGKVPII